MPTTARLVAAILMAALGWGAATLAIAHLPEGTQVGLFAPVSAGWGVIIGWVWVGRKIEAGGARPLGIGLSGTVLQVFWVLLTFSGDTMLRRALHVSYDGPISALEDLMAIGLKYLRLETQIDVIGVLLIGGLLVGAITGWVARRFR